jgi:hypothetical protein
MTQAALSTTHTIDLPYEIDHLRAAYRLLPVYGPQDKHLQNLLIEGFWLHARNLVEMFLEKRNATDPSDVASSSYAPKDPVKLGDYYGRICKQITHLKDGRPVADVDKLNSRDPNFITLIEDEIAHFLGHVGPDVLAHLGPDKIGTPMLPDVIAPQAPSATNAPIAFGWTGPAAPSNTGPT